MNIKNIVSAIVIIGVIVLVVVFNGKSSNEIVPANDNNLPDNSTASSSASSPSADTPAVTPAKPIITPTPEPKPEPVGITMATVQLHSSKSSCYTTIRGKVYDLTSWVSNHPGGEKAILSICGKDGTAAFEGQHGGDSKPENTLASFYIGELAK